jgi:uncharacterized metal-binding protein
MPNGHTHDSVTWFLVTPMAFGAWSVAHDIVGAGISATAFAFAGLMFSGDLDLQSSQYRRWGKLRWIWKPYQWVVPHRSAVSHGIFLGPAGRLLYLALVGVIAVACGIRAATGVWAVPWPALSLAGHLVREWDARTWIFVAYALAGLWLGGASHSLADWGWSAFKRRLR